MLRRDVSELGNTPRPRRRGAKAGPPSRGAWVLVLVIAVLSAMGAAAILRGAPGAGEAERWDRPAGDRPLPAIIAG